MKKFLLKFLTIIFALTLYLGVFSACGESGCLAEVPNHSHNFTILKYDDNSHWYECSCGDKNNVENHKGGTATETQKAVCEICSQEYGNSVEHVHNFDKKLNSIEYLASEATCSKKAKYYYSCSCLEKGSETYEVGETLPHNYVGNKCSNCNEWKISEGLVFEENENGYFVTGIGTCKDSVVVIPSTYNNKPVTSIGELAFFECSTLTGVVIPDSVTSIEKTSFAYCISLESITMGNGVKNIGWGAFGECSSLTTVAIPNSVINIDEFAFYCCPSLTSVEIGSHVTSIGDFAFSGCSLLTSIVVDTNNEKYKSIDGNLYSKDGKTLMLYATGKNNTTFIVPNSVTNIGNKAFDECNLIENIVLPSSVKTISKDAFYCCTSLISVVISDSLTSIDNNAFSGCYSLASIKYRGTESQWNAISKSEYWNSDTGDYIIVFNYTGE